MKRQLISAVGIIYVHNLSTDKIEPNVLGEIFYMRRTRIFRRKVRKVIYSFASPLGGHSVERMKLEMRRLLNNEIQRYYNEPQG